MGFKAKWAVLIGVDKYDHLAALNYCSLDVVALRDALVVHLEFPKDHIFTFCAKGQVPSRGKILQQLADLKNHVNENDLLLFYFSGHGMQRDDNDYLLPPEAGPDVLKDTGIETRRVVELLSKTGCKNIVVFLDACRGEVGDKSPFGDDSGSIGDITAEAALKAGVATFFSCDPKDRSWEIKKLRHGAFTYCLLQAVRRWECRTIGEINNFLRREVPHLNRHHKERTQQPHVTVDRAEKLNLPIFELPGSREDYDPLIEQLADCFAIKGELDEVYYNKSIKLLERAKREAPDVRDRKRIYYCERLVEGKLILEAFQRAWDAVERLEFGPTKIRKRMPRITK